MRVDVAYWLFNPLVTKWVTRLALFLILGFATLPASTQPPALQAVEMLILADFIGYWLHRAFHHPILWRFHAIHHSSTKLDWIAAARVHPVNEIVTRLVQVVPLYLLGFRSLAIAPLLTLYAVLLHADLPSPRPLRYVIAKPHFHRWHHAANGNFAGLFPVWDWLFGTLVLPPDPPTRFGVPDAVPPTFLAQLAWPFARK